MTSMEFVEWIVDGRFRNIIPDYYYIAILMVLYTIMCITYMYSLYTTIYFGVPINMNCIHTEKKKCRCIN